MKKEVKNTIEKMNTIVYFDDLNFDIGMKILNDNLVKEKIQHLITKLV